MLLACSVDLNRLLVVFMVLVKKAESEGGSGGGFLCHVVDNVCVHGPVWLEVSSLRASRKENVRRTIAG